MKLATFLAPHTTTPTAGEVRDGRIVTFTTGTVIDHLGDPTPATGPAYDLDQVALLEPIPRPPAIFCIGRNYAAHIAELGSERPSKPLVFLKLPLSSTPPGGPVVKPKASDALDYESELVLVMGQDHAVAGYAVANDVSARDLQRSEAQWSRAKGFDTSCPWGPWITTRDEIPDPRALAITTHVNGELRQDGNTRDLIFGPEELVAFISEACTLEPGAIILTGTPSGVGEAFDPPRYLQPGDTVRCAIEGLGVLEHRISETR
jgi:2-keto-4-pentenoate hydratase/2-oxohepta-3-ene-1,7-dioic acid hydratase in catechol pathway